ncbi:MAG: histidine--tRNA ligase [Bacilli bacterium]
MIQKPKGTYDLFGQQGKKFLALENMIKAIMENYNYEYFRTPLFESSDLFHRGVGETTDIVSKETYDFTDRGDRLMTLRPEGTAGIVRSLIENKLYADPNQPIKTWYYGPMYRYERPQSGRFREFYQFGTEVFGSNNPVLDAEIISIPVNLFKLIGLKGIKVNINSLGDSESRNNYRKILIEYFKENINDLCDDCQTRYNKNPLRILDCKVDSNSEIIKKAPKTIEYLNEESKQHFDELKKYLEIMGIEYNVNPKIVRGLDYYTHTVFEVEADIEGFGSQNVLAGGGRYNSLVETIGGPQIPGVGFALGIERLLNAIECENLNIADEETLDVYVIPMNELDDAIELVQTLRLSGFKTDMDYLNRNIKSNFKQADRMNAKYIIIIGEEEIETKNLTIKNNITKEEYKISYDNIIEFLDEHIEV